MDEAVVVARQVAQKVANGLGRANCWREYWGDAWVSVARSCGKGFTIGMANRRAHWDLLDLERIETGDRRKLRIQYVDISLFPVIQLLANVPTPDEPQRRQELWEETKLQRQELPMRYRVVLYLLTVEAWNRGEVAEYLGCSLEAIHLVVMRAQQRMGVRS
jgi:hypothetical protein